MQIVQSKNICDYIFNLIYFSKVDLLVSFYFLFNITFKKFIITKNKRPNPFVTFYFYFFFWLIKKKIYNSKVKLEKTVILLNKKKQRICYILNFFILSGTKRTH